MIQDGNESWIDEPNALEEYYIMGGEGAFPKLESGRFGIWEKALMCYQGGDFPNVEVYENKIASIISKYACELGSINKNQAKAIVHAINGGKTHQMIMMMDGSNSHKCNSSLSN